MVELKQFYTETALSKELASLISLPNPMSCLELSAGEGSLLDSVLEKYPEIRITAIDIDPKNHSKLIKKYSKHVVLCGDATDTELINKIKYKRFDIAVCNPPFKSIDNNRNHRALINNILGKDVSSKKIRAELIFLCLNLSLINSDGQLAIILPDLFFCSANYSWLRETLATRFKISTIIECAHNSFQKTEAKTHIYHIEKTSLHPRDNITYVVGGLQKIISPHEFIRKFDDSIDTESVRPHYSICRGSMSGKQCKESGLPYFHTSSFANSEDYNRSIDECLINKPTASCGDILIARVGTRVLGKTIVYAGQPALISDCIFRIRFDNQELRDCFLNEWESVRDKWIKDNANGTCAKHFSMRSMRTLVSTIINSSMIPP